MEDRCAIWARLVSDPVSGVGALPVRALEMDCTLGMDLAGRSALGFCAVALWPVDPHRRALGLDPWRLRRAAALCAGNSRVPWHTGYRVEFGGGADGCMVSPRAGRALLAELYARPGLHSQSECRDSSRCRVARNASGRRPAFGNLSRRLRQPVA